MDTLETTIAFLGAGNMARAIAGGLVRTGLVPSHRMVASDVSPAALAALESAVPGLRVAAGNAGAAAGADVVILAVKPWGVAEVCASIRDDIRPDTLVISICAGITTAAIEAALRGDGGLSEPRVVRVMPNTPALIGAGSAACAAGAHATDDDLQLAVRLFRSVGAAVAVTEDKLDLVTGLTGSGPAYVFRFLEALIAAGTELGLTETEARTLVPAMVLGAARMAVESGRELHELRDAVTTKGGTTEAGLRTLEEGDFMQLVHDAVAAATARSRELRQS